MSTRIVVAADNRSLSLGLAGLDYDVVDVDPSELATWGKAAKDADVLVVGIDDAQKALSLVRDVDALHPGMPSLVVCGDAVGWAAMVVDGLNVDMLPLPVTRPALVAAIDRLTAAVVAVASVPPAAAPPAPPAAAPAAPVPATPAERSAEATPEPHRRMVAARSTDGLRERLAGRVPDAGPRPSPAVEHKPAPERPPVVEHNPAVDHRPAVDHAHAVPHRPGPARPRRIVASAAGVHDMVRALSACSDQLYDVRDIARAVVEESTTAVDVTAAVMMLPDGDVWKVCAAVDTRPLEWRYVIEPDSWVVTTVVDGDRAVIVEESDIARQRLGGAPLAHHKHLMIVPIAEPRGIIVLARDDAPFTETELSSLAAIAADAGPVLSDGLDLRSLARTLSEFRAIDD